MDKINFIHKYKGRSTKRALITSKKLAFAFVPNKNIVHIAIPGANEDWIHFTDFNITNEVYSTHTELYHRILDKIKVTAEQVDTFSATVLTEYKDSLKSKKKPKQQYHRDYLVALLEEHLTYQNKEWKP